MNINFTLIVIVMLFVILMSIQLTLNKIYVILREIRELMKLKKNKE
ncbi:MAG: hypothetical protein E7E21_06695 [Peptostreptococcaceae bacterium]|uniref:Uncharacterized protein n=1 Tax=Romboutsia faecis TaxID=2764597 RepID=A0ABR7JQ60_9FIRM|nr:hypothetical protein [Romboutsia faecis]MBC5997051.1 hypothetical protein [Romboutsia faecis]MDU2198086.1 hypothetical protein [Peptostreptococcaceae bacterium]MDU4934392.1 hypothetical protein [Peptostreptococcaceae bacterium]